MSVNNENIIDLMNENTELALRLKRIAEWAADAILEASYRPRADWYKGSGYAAKRVLELATTSAGPHKDKETPSPAHIVADLADIRRQIGPARPRGEKS